LLRETGGSDRVSRARSFHADDVDDLGGPSRQGKRSHHPAEGGKWMLLCASQRYLVRYLAFINACVDAALFFVGYHRRRVAIHHYAILDISPGLRAFEPVLRLTHSRRASKAPQALIFSAVD